MKIIDWLLFDSFINSSRYFIFLLFDTWWRRSKLLISFRNRIHVVSFQCTVLTIDPPITCDHYEIISHPTHFQITTVHSCCFWLITFSILPYILQMIFISYCTCNSRFGYFNIMLQIEFLHGSYAYSLFVVSMHFCIWVLFTFDELHKVVSYPR